LSEGPPTREILQVSTMMFVVAYFGAYIPREKRKNFLPIPLQAIGTMHSEKFVLTRGIS
jgi:hypothetical protein